MKISINLYPLHAQGAGLLRYGTLILHGLAEYGCRHQYAVHCNTLMLQHFRSEKSQLYVSTSSAHQRALFYWDLLYGVKFALETAADIWHFPVSGPPLVCPRKSAATVHDLTCITYPDTMTPGARLYWEAALKRAVEHCAMIIVQSQSVRDELLEWSGIADERVALVPTYLAPHFSRRPNDQERARTLQRYGIPGPFFLSVGTSEPRKNLPRVLAAYRIATEDDPHIPPLVLIGSSGWLTDTNETIRSLGLSRRVRHLGFVPDEDMPALYSSATAFLFLSLYEGFGAPVLEAMASGTPVITSNCSSLPEVTGTAAMLVDPRDEAAIAAALVMLAGDSGLREKLRDEGKARAATFDMRTSTEKLLRVYENMASA